MSKKFKMSLPILAIVVGLAASAFTIKPEANQNKKSEDLYWFNAGVQTQSQATVDITDINSEQMSTGCTALGSGCKDGYPSSQVTISGSNYVASGTPQSQIRNQ